MRAILSCRPVPSLNRLAALLLLASPSGLWADAPAVRVIAAYEGASAQTVVDTVTAPIEEQLRGLDGVTSIRSESRAGHAVITVYLKPKSDLPIAQVLVQNRVALALPVLPSAVQLAGISVRLGDGIRPPALWLILASERRDILYLSSYAELNLRPALERVPLVRGVRAMGASRPRLSIWLDPDKLAARGLDAADVTEALRNYEAPKGDGEAALKRLLTSVDAIADLILKTTIEGQVVRLRDVARVELGGRPQTEFARWNGRRVVALAVDAEEEDAAAVRAALLREVKQLGQRLPEGVTFEPILDFTRKDNTGLLVEAQLPDAASLERVEKVVAQAERIVKEVGGVEGVLSVSDQAPLGRLFVRVKDVDEARPRVRRRLAAEVVDAACRVTDLKTHRLPPERRTAVSLIVQDRQDRGLAALQETADALRHELAKSPHLVDTWSDFRATVPSLYLDIDRTKMAALGVPNARLLEVIAVSGLPGSVVDPRFDIQLGKAEARPWSADQLKGLKVRNGTGEMVPVTAFVTVKEVGGPRQINHFDGWTTALVSADLVPGASIEDARKACRTAANAVPKGYRVLLSGAGMEKPEDVTTGK